MRNKDGVCAEYAYSGRLMRPGGFHVCRCAYARMDLGVSYPADVFKRACVCVCVRHTVGVSEEESRRQAYEVQIAALKHEIADIQLQLDKERRGYVAMTHTHTHTCTHSHTERHPRAGTLSLPLCMRVSWQ